MDQNVHRYSIIPVRPRLGVAALTSGLAAAALGAVTLLGACAVPDEPALEDDGAQALGGTPSPGAPGIGDPLYPTLGNGGYEVDHYHLDLRYATAAPSQPLDGTVTILARATAVLSRFNLDFAGDSVGAVRVDGRPAAYTWDGGELVITPHRPLRRGEHFTVTISDFAATPVAPDPDVFLDAPFFLSPDGTAWAGQPDNANRIFPSNDHPSDKASFTFKIDVPAGTTAVASGELVARHTFGGRAIWWYVQPEPMATELAQVAVGAYTVTDRGDHGGVHLRDVTPARLTAELAPKLAGVAGQLDWLRARLGAYPFQSYGSLVIDAPIGFALETQTLSLYDAALFTASEEDYAMIMVHELAHQWFGNSVSPARWSDLWLNEGHASWYELTFAIPDPAGLDNLARIVYSLGDIWRVAFGPVGAPPSGDPSELFNPNVYYGGALVLYALRQQIGAPAFEALERAWVTKHRGRAASTEDFIALASEVSGQDLSAFLHAWIFGTTTPPMPGHPDWTVDPLPPQVPLAPGARATAAAVPMKGLRPLLRH